MCKSGTLGMREEGFKLWMWWKWLKMYADDYSYRFHAWQSALLFSAIFVLHLIFIWSTFMSWVIFIGDLGLIGYLTMRAYKDGKWCSSTKKIWRLTMPSGYA